jgi:serine/alanine adding enzyme
MMKEAATGGQQPVIAHGQAQMELTRIRDDWQDQRTWDAFVESNVEGRFAHLYNYGMATECYGFRSQRICFVKGSEIVAVVPMALTRSLLFGRKLISQPFSEYGGLLVAAELDLDEIREIVGSLRAHIAKKFKDVALEINGNHGIPSSLNEELFAGRHPHLLAYLELDSNVDEVWQRKISYEARKAVNKARKSGLAVKEECNEATLRGPFFSLYCESMKRLGVPPHNLRYYLDCYKAFGDKMKIFWAMKDSIKVAGLLGFACGHRISIINIVSDPAYWNLRPNDLIHWEFIRFAAENGYSFFDFGSVRYDGQEHFKRKWGCTFIPHSHYYLMSKQQDALRTFDSSSSMMSQFSNMWTRWMPAALANKIGPVIRKQLAR